MMKRDPFDQSGYRCRFGWGQRAVSEAAARGDVVVIVDVLSFSTTVATAAQHDASVYPCAEREDAAALAARIGGEVAVHRDDVPARGRFSLSPLSFGGAPAGARVVLPSPNGATCARLARDAPHVFAGALVNARAVGRAVDELLDGTGRGVTVVACGERWGTPSGDGALRFALEDYLGAGAVLSHIQHPRSPEAEVCARAFAASRGDLTELLMECASGQELTERGWERDVLAAAAVGTCDVAPALHGDHFARHVRPAGDG